MQAPSIPVISVPAVMKWAMAAVLAWWARDVPAAMQTLILLMCVDYATGVVAAGIEGTWSRRQGLVGLTQKVALISMLVFARWLERLGGHEWGAETLGASAYAVNESISIVLNFARIGVPIPGQWVESLLAVKKVVRFRRATPAELADLSKDEDRPRL